MGKCWMVEEDEKGHRILLDHTFGPEIEIWGKLTEYPSNPLEPIREVWAHMKDFPEDFYEDRSLSIFRMREAIEKCMAIVEGK